MKTSKWFTIIFRNLLISIFTLPSLAFATNSEIYTKALLSAFGQGCQSHGELTTISMNHSDSIIKMIRSIQNDSSCSQWAQSLQSSIGTIDQYSTDTSAYNVNQLTHKLSNLQEALEIESNSNIRASLASKLAETQVELHMLGTESNDRIWQNRKSTISNFHQFSSNLSATLNSNIHCVQKYPGLVMQIGGQIMNIAGNFNLWGNIAGIGLMGAGAAIDMALSAIRGARFTRSLKKIENSKLTEALICTFEKVSKNYCSGASTKKRVTQMAEGKYHISNDEWPGIQISQSISLYNKWVSKLVSGTPSSNTAISARKVNAIKMRENLKITREFTSGYYQEGVDLISLTSDIDEQESLISEIIENISDEISRHHSNSKTNPFKSAFRHFTRRAPSVYFYTGELRPNFQSNNEDSYSYIQRTIGYITPPSLELVAYRLGMLLKKAQKYTDSKFSQVKEVDPELVVMMAEKGHKTNLNILSPISMIKSIPSYIDYIFEKFQDSIPPHISYTMQQTKNITAKALLAYDLTLQDFSSTTSSKLLMTKLQKLLAPEMKIKFLSDRMKIIINFEMRRKLTSAMYPSSINSILRKSKYDHLKALEQYIGKDFNQMLMDSRGAMRNSYENLDALAEIFDSKIKRILKDLYKKKRKNPKITAFSDTLNMICASLLSVPNIRRFNYKAKLSKYCKGTKLVSIYPNSKIELLFDKLIRKDFTKRVCAYNKYISKNKYYHQLK